MTDGNTDRVAFGIFIVAWLGWARIIQDFWWLLVGHSMHIVLAGIVSLIGLLLLSRMVVNVTGKST